MNKKKLFRITTISGSLATLLKGQLKFLNQEFEVVGIAKNTGELKEVEEKEKIRTINIPFERQICISKDIISLIELYKLFKKEHPYIVHANTPKASLLSMIAAWLTCVPIRIYTVTGLRFETTHGIFRFILKTMERITCFCATKVIPEGDGVKNTLYREHITSKPLQKILNGNINGIDTAYFSLNAIHVNRREMRNSMNISDDDFVFIFVGRIVRDKGINELCEAIKRLSEKKVKLILVGTFENKLDPISAENEKFINESNVIKFVGFQTDIRPFLAIADALVFPSYREGFPNVVMQAGAMGLPSIVTDINGCNEIIIQDKNGVIIPSHDNNALYKAMCIFIENRKEVQKMADNARDLITSRYEQKDVWRALLAEYKSLEQTTHNKP